MTYTGLIQACLDSGSVQNGAYIFSQMHNFCSPNIVTCNIMLKAYIEHKMFEEAKDLFQKILDGTRYLGRISDYKNCVIPDKFTFNTMLEACIEEKRWDDFENFYRRMLHHGYHFNPKRHQWMIMEASRAGKVFFQFSYLKKNSSMVHVSLNCFHLEDICCTLSIGSLNIHRIILQRGRKCYDLGVLLWIGNASKENSPSDNPYSFNFQSVQMDDKKIKGKSHVQWEKNP